jgi:hypothetical protein
MDLVKIGWGGVDWIGVAHERFNSIAVVNAVTNRRVLYNTGESGYTTGISRVVLSSIELVHTIFDRV